MDFQKFLQNEGKVIEKANQEHIFMQGDEDRSLYYVQQGLLKAYYISDDGKEYIKSFLLSGDTIGSLTSVYNRHTCSFNLLCLEPAVLIQFEFDKLFELSRADQDLANSVNEFLLMLAMKKEQREYEFLCLSAEERYCLLLERSKPLIDKVTQNDIARYLGITPVALSRIKKRLQAE